MWDFKIGRCAGLMFQTFPFIALRTLVYFGCSLLLILGFVGGPALGAWLAPASAWEVGAWVGFGVGARLVHGDVGVATQAVARDDRGELCHASDHSGGHEAAAVLLCVDIAQRQGGVVD